MVAGQLCGKNTVWKFKNFSVTLKFLREIDFDEENHLSKQHFLESVALNWLKLISRKIWVVEKISGFHTVTSSLNANHDKGPLLVDNK